MIKNKLLINKSKRIEVKIYIGLDKKQNIIADHDKEILLKDKQLISKEEELFEVKMWFRQPNYGDDLALAQNTIHQRIDEDGTSMSIDTIKIRNDRFKQLLADWDLTDEDDEPLEVNEENVNSLDPSFAGAALEGLEKALGQ